MFFGVCVCRGGGKAMAIINNGGNKKMLLNSLVRLI